MKLLLAIGIALLASSSSWGADTGGELFKQLCASCHVHNGGNRIAPPIFAVKRHVKLAYPKREEFIQRIVDWVKEPSVEKALMQGAVRKFGVMPKLPYSESDVRKVAEYLYG